MKFFAILLAIALRLVYAAECAESDLLTLAPSMLACETTLGQSVSSIARGDISTFFALCKYSDSIEGIWSAYLLIEWPVAHFSGILVQFTLPNAIVGKLLDW
ncbi:hypothetical protein Ae201684P_008077 [Aphanomyces euteiches]|nr:hypothetical protein Ae201684P_008077 [Aphanomyces euteiches]